MTVDEGAERVTTDYADFIKQVRCVLLFIS